MSSIEVLYNDNGVIINFSIVNRKTPLDDFRIFNLTYFRSDFQKTPAQTCRIFHILTIYRYILFYYKLKFQLPTESCVKCREREKSCQNSFFFRLLSITIK